MSMLLVALKIAASIPSVSAKIFVTKTFRDLKIFFDASDLEQLFVLLRRLRKSVKLSRHQSARHQKISRPFRSALRQNRSFNFQVALRIEIIARHFGRPMTDAQITRQPRPPQI